MGYWIPLVRNVLCYVLYSCLLFVAAFRESHALQIAYSNDIDPYISAMAGCLISAIALTGATNLLFVRSRFDAFQPGHKVLIAASVTIAASWVLSFVVVAYTTDIESNQRIGSLSTLVEGVLSIIAFGVAAVWERDAIAWKAVLGYQAALSFCAVGSVVWPVFYDPMVLVVATSIGILLLGIAVSIECGKKRSRDLMHYIGAMYLTFVYVRVFIGI